MSVRTDVWMDRWNCYCRTDLSNGCFTERAIVNRWCFAFCFSNVCLTYRSWFWSKSLLKMGGYRRAGGMLVTLHPCFYIWYLNTCIQASKIKEWGWLAKKKCIGGRVGIEILDTYVVELYFPFHTHSCDMGYCTHPVPCYWSFVEPQSWSLPIIRYEKLACLSQKSSSNSSHKSIAKCLKILDCLMAWAFAIPPSRCTEIPLLPYVIFIGWLK